MASALVRASYLSPEPAPAVERAALPWSRAASPIAAACLLLADVLVFIIAAVAAAELREVFLGAMDAPRAIGVSAVAWLAARYWAGLYPGYGLSAAEEVRMCTLTSLGAGAAHIAILFLMKEQLTTSRLVAGLTWTLVAALGVAGRGLVKHALVAWRLYGAPVIVAGAGPAGLLVVRQMKANPGLGYVPVAVFDDDPSKIGTGVEGVPVLGPLRAARIAEFPYSVKHAVVAMPGAPAARVVAIARDLSRRYPHLGVVPDLVGLPNVWLRPRAIGTCLTLEFRNNLLDPFNRALKRGADIVLAGVALVLSAPVILLSAVAVKMMSPGPAFYYQQRRGVGGRPIRLWKIRTMVLDAEAQLARHLAGDPHARAEWTAHMKLRNDPRIIPSVGRILRQFSLDELPQLWNVLRGEMSLVGPRPLPDYHLRQLAEDFKELRQQVRPGITGMWQVTGRSRSTLEVQQSADSDYIRNWSLWLDLWIIYRTIPVAAKGDGAY